LEHPHHAEATITLAWENQLVRGDAKSRTEVQWIRDVKLPLTA
jgi:hypothetical protein